jgi:two-component system response regulator AtoC
VGDTVVENDSLEMIGSHPRMMEVHKTIGLLSRSRLTVLIQGESGTGKELAARILHNASASDKPFVAVNCSAVVPTLLESEFFGHERGAFTGADKVKIGKLQYAGEGTVFLDEIGDMPLDLQGKLLRVLQEEEFVRVGGLEHIRLQARIVAATHHDLEKLIREEKFRRDLYYRLAVSSIILPPLRERRSDIAQLVEFLLRKISGKLNRTVATVSESALQHLMHYDWPGNIRELENVLTRAAALSSRKVLQRSDLDTLTMETAGTPADTDMPLTLFGVEKKHIEKVLIMNNWNITRSAQMLDISRTTLRKKIKDYQLRE